MKYAIVPILFLCSSTIALATEHRCSADAAERAKKLLAFHLEQEIEAGFEGPFLKTPIRNPANPKQKFDVLEVLAYVGPHGEYRMRFIYSATPSSCLLMGQEILEHAIP